MIARVGPNAVPAKALEERLRLHDEHERAMQQQKQQGAKEQLRAEAARRAATGLDPSSKTNNGAAPMNATPAHTPVPSLPRNLSPHRLSSIPARGNHFRSRSSGSSVVAPAMARAHSSPIVPSSQSPNQFSTSPASSPRSFPVRSPGLRSLSPLQPSIEEDSHHASVTSSPFYEGAIQSISEDAELHFKPRAALDSLPQPIPLHASLNSARPLSVRRQRPTSPLNSLGNTPYTPHPGTSRSSSGASSPSMPPGRFNEGYPALHHYSSASSVSSVPSTPTSTRSRSPSVSSLETIEDTPDLEWEAIEAERAAKLAAAEQGQDSEIRRRGSLDIPGARSGVGFGFGRRGDNGKKRWSVCGGERRADLDLETIWED